MSTPDPSVIVLVVLSVGAFAVSKFALVIETGLPMVIEPPRNSGVEVVPSTVNEPVVIARFEPGTVALLSRAATPVPDPTQSKLPSTVNVGALVTSGPSSSPPPSSERSPTVESSVDDVSASTPPLTTSRSPSAWIESTLSPSETVTVVPASQHATSVPDGGASSDQLVPTDQSPDVAVYWSKLPAGHVACAPAVALSTLARDIAAILPATSARTQRLNPHRRSARAPLISPPVSRRPLVARSR